MRRKQRPLQLATSNFHSQVGSIDHHVPRKLQQPRPKQGAHLASLRKEAGLTQAELAHAVGETQQNIAFWEKSQKPPRSDVLPRMVKVFGVPIEALLVDQAVVTRKKTAPVGQVQHAFEEVRRLPRRQQRQVVELVETLIERFVTVRPTAT